MKTIKLNDGVTIRECMGDGCYSIVKGRRIEPEDLRSTDVRFALTGNKDDYTMSFAVGSLMISTLINSDHILIMKQILKEMGEI